MNINDLKAPEGSIKKRKRVGRGNASGHGTYSTRGSKGQKAHGSVHPRFEGGQLPLVKRLPRKRGFTNIFRIEYTVVNVSQLSVFENGAEINPVTLVEAGIVRNFNKPIKILGRGEITKSLKVKADWFSDTAREKITAAGGMAEEFDYAEAEITEE